MARQKKTYPARHTVSIEVNGNPFTGEYYVEDKMITVVPPEGFPITTQLGGHEQHPDVLARLLLTEAAKPRS